MNKPVERPEQNEVPVDIIKRLEVVEQRLGTLENRMNAGEAMPRTSPPHQAASSGKPIPTPSAGNGFEVSERWLQRLGIALLLVGLAFLFKYSIDRAWLTPWVRIGIVLAVGSLMLGLALRFASSRLLLARTLSGGGIACIYGALYAAFELYHLIGIVSAFAGMLLTTAGAFALSLGAFGAPMAVLGTIGGFITPFILYADRENILGLLIYNALLTLGSLAIYLWHRWRSLLWLTVIGAWSVVINAFVASGHSVFGLPDIDAKFPLRVTTIGLWMVFALLPLRGWRRGTEVPAEAMLVISSPIVGLLLCEKMWVLSDYHWVAIWVGVAIVYAVIATVNRRMPTFSWLHMLMGALLLSVGLWHVLGEQILLLAVSSEAIALMALARRISSPWPRRLAHAVFAICLYILFWRLLHNNAQGMPLINRQALTDLDVLGLAVIAAWVSGKSGRDVYAILVYVGLLILAYREFSTLANGQAWVSAIWAMCAVGLLFGSLRSNHTGMRRLALGTLMLVAAKLLLVDLSHIEAIWRILVSAGLGGVFLLLSYILPGLGQRMLASHVTESRSELVDHDEEPGD